MAESGELGGRALARLFGLMYVGGAVLLGGWLLLPHPPVADLQALWATALSGLLIGVLFLAGVFDSRSARFFSVAVGLATALTSCGVFFSHDPASGVGLFYLWIAPIAYVFFPLGQAILQTVWMAVCSAAVLLSWVEFQPLQESWDAGRWLLTLGTIVAVGSLSRELTRSLVGSEARFRGGFRGSSIGMALVSTQGRFLEVNDALAEILVEWTPFGGLLMAFGVRPGKDRCSRAPNPTCISRAVPS